MSWHSGLHAEFWWECVLLRLVGRNYSAEMLFVWGCRWDDSGETKLFVMEEKASPGESGFRQVNSADVSA